VGKRSQRLCGFGGPLRERPIRDRDTLAEQLQGAVTNWVITEQAKGVLAERSGLDMPDAFAALRSRARRRIDCSWCA